MLYSIKLVVTCETTILIRNICYQYILVYKTVTSSKISLYTCFTAGRQWRAFDL